VWLVELLSAFSVLAPLSHLLSILRLVSSSKLQCSFEQSKLMQIKSQNLKNSFPNFEIMPS